MNGACTRKTEQGARMTGEARENNDRLKGARPVNCSNGRAQGRATRLRPGEIRDGLAGKRTRCLRDRVHKATNIGSGAEWAPWASSRPALGKEIRETEEQGRAARGAGTAEHDAGSAGLGELLTELWTRRGNAMASMGEGARRAHPPGGAMAKKTSNGDQLWPDRRR